MTAKEDIRDRQRRMIRENMERLGISATELARRAGIAHTTISRFMNEDVKHVLSSTTMAKIGQVLQRQSQEWVDQTPDEKFPSKEDGATIRKKMGEISSALEIATEKLAEAERIDFRAENPTYILEHIHGRDFLNDNLPVIGHARGGHEGFFFENGVVHEFVPRPDPLRRVADAYAVYVNGASMEPRYYSGELVYVNPVRPPRAGDFVVVEFDDGQGFVKQLVKQTGDLVILHQFNPDKLIEVPRERIKLIHLIIGSLS